MALAKGINGTFAPTDYEYEPIELANIRKIKKTVSINGVWEERIFIMLTDNSNRSTVQDWLKQHYGASQYCVTWWPTFNTVCMLDKIYTHWKLCE